MRCDRCDGKGRHKPWCTIRREQMAEIRDRARMRADPELREDVLKSIMSSMAADGIVVDRERSARWLDAALDGPPLVYNSPER